MGYIKFIIIDKFAFCTWLLLQLLVIKLIRWYSSTHFSTYVIDAKKNTEFIILILISLQKFTKNWKDSSLLLSQHNLFNYLDLRAW
jgi:hypothetical protein